jgi:hypothetical protein
MTTAAVPSTSVRSRRRGLLTPPAAAGIAYVAAWVTGLAIWPSNLDVAASGMKVVSAYAGHRSVAVVQDVLVEGLAAIALAVVAIALGRAAGRRGERRLGRIVVFAGVGAASVSLVQCVLGLVLAGVATPDAAGTLFDVINRMDGAKMVVLAAMALAGIGLARRGVLPHWLGHVAVLLAAALVTSGVGYLLLDNALAQAAAASLPLLLIWVASTGVTLGRRSE